MSNECQNNCDQCSDTENCSKADFSIKGNELNDIKRTVAVVSGKGGVGKSLVTSLLGVMMRRKGYQVGILDADITGPSIPKVFGVEDTKPEGTGMGLFPVKTTSEIRLMSINLLLDKSDSPVIWRGPIISGTVKQFWTDVIWGDLDYMFIDMPPGTGDVPLTVFQSIPLDGIIIVTSPQDLVSLIVKKAFNMARSMNIPVLGIVENMSYAICPKCGDRINIFGESKAEKVAQDMGIPFLGRMPVDPELAALCDKGEIERYYMDYVDGCAPMLEKLLPKNH
jgi:ATP-binding protein involved in chromosome partitioning